MESKKALRLKIVLLGSPDAGKTSLMWRFMRDEFIAQSSATTLCSFPCRTVTIDGVDAEVELWDTAGQERYCDMTRLYYRGADCAVAVYDIGARMSFDALEYWSKELTLKAGPRVVPEESFSSERWEAPSLVVVGNKADLVEVVSWSEAHTWARTKAASLFICSAKTGEGVKDAFLEAARLGLSRRLLLAASFQE